jgi:hypothetical protein
MDELKLRYVIQLLSNIERQSRKDAKALEDAQKQSEEAVQKTTRAIGRMEAALLSVGRVATWGSRRQADYLASLSRGYLNLERAAIAATTAMKKAAQATPQVAAGTVAAGWAAIGAVVGAAGQLQGGLIGLEMNWIGCR